jgi:hypothetical protein
MAESDLFMSIFTVAFITPRINDRKGKPLPTSRKISNAISKSMTSTPRSSRITVLHTHFGQMVSHDVIATPVLKG